MGRGKPTAVKGEWLLGEWLPGRGSDYWEGGVATGEGE